MDYDFLNTLRRQHPGWRLLAADHGPLIAAFLHRYFIEPNQRSFAEAELTSRLEDFLFHLRERLGDDVFPKSARDYLNDWAADERGWDNRDKIKALEAEADNLARQGQALATQLNDWETERKMLDGQLRTLDSLTLFTDFSELDWRPVATELERLEQERRNLEQANDTLRELEQQLRDLESSLADNDAALTDLGKAEGANQTKTQTAQALHEENQAEFEAADEQQQTCFAQLVAYRGQVLPDRTLTVESCDGQQRDLREWLQSEIGRYTKQLGRVRDRIISAMRQHQNDWPLESRDVDATLASGNDYRDMLDELKRDDLPRFERRFKAFFNENTIREVAAFQGQLHKEGQTIRERIDIINRSLYGIDYNPGRYIKLLPETTNDQEVRAFQTDLRACTEGALSGSEDEQYTERSFCKSSRSSSAFAAVKAPVSWTNAGRKKLPMCVTGLYFRPPNAGAKMIAPMNIIRIRRANPEARRKSWPTRFWRPAWPINSGWSGVSSVRVRSGLW